MAAQKKRTSKKKQVKRATKKMRQPSLEERGPQEQPIEEMSMTHSEEFDEPTVSDDETLDDFGEAEAPAEFDEPNEQELDASSESFDGEDPGDADFDDDLLEAHAGVESFLSQQVQSANAAGVSAMAEDGYDGAGNVLGVGLGFAEDDLTLGCDPGSPTLNLYVAEPCSADDAQTAVVDSMGVSAAASEKVPVNVIVTGPIDAQPHRFRIRPAPGGVSVGHTRVTAGTLGCLARGRSGSRKRRVLMLSNNHVLANSNNAQRGNTVIQPGRADGGTSPADRVALLERWVPINFSGGANLVDCATAWCWPGRVRRQLVYVRRGRRRFFRISSRVVRCRRGQLVGKSGRTTQITAGRITDCKVTIRVNYRPRVALFRDQIAIRGLRGDFSRGGDSGSVIWTVDRRRNPVGLLFAGGGGVTFANKMTHVRRALDINLWT